MQLCPSCGAQVQQGISICPDCGGSMTPAPTMGGQATGDPQDDPDMEDNADQADEALVTEDNAA
jgi:uncharacterized membrane protein YvbJ